MTLVYKRPGFAFAAIGASLIAALSGCIGGGDSKDSSTTTDETGVTVGPPPTTDGSDCNTDPSGAGCQGVADPKRHFHHYWGDPPIPEVNIFYKPDLALQTDAFKGSEFGCRSVGHVEFDLETDGDDATGDPDSVPINPSPANGGPPRADTVFAGAGAIRIELKSLPDTPAFTNGLAQLFFRYKPANLNFYQPDGGCGMELTVGQPLTIPVGSGAADPPHQWAVSRWRFFIMAAHVEGQTELPTLGSGAFHLEMYALNGGEKSLDPAHPNLWGESLTYDLGCAKVDGVERQLIVWAPGTPPAHKPPQEPIADIKWQYGRIVPLLTQRVEIKVEGSNTAPGASPIELWYYAADSNRYTRAQPVEVDGNGWGTYEVPDPQGIKADPPYEDETLWRFMILPKPIGQAVTLPPTPLTSGGDSWVTAFEGSFQMCAMAHRDPSAVLT